MEGRCEWWHPLAVASFFAQNSTALPCARRDEPEATPGRSPFTRAGESVFSWRAESVPSSAERWQLRRRPEAAGRLLGEPATEGTQRSARMLARCSAYSASLIMLSARSSSSCVRRSRTLWPGSSGSPPLDPSAPEPARERASGCDDVWDWSRRCQSQRDGTHSFSEVSRLHRPLITDRDPFLFQGLRKSADVTGRSYICELNRRHRRRLPSSHRTVTEQFESASFRLTRVRFASRSALVVETSTYRRGYGADHRTTIEKRPTRYVPGVPGCGRRAPPWPPGPRLGS
jgi:hypothetical protein